MGKSRALVKVGGDGGGIVKSHKPGNRRPVGFGGGAEHWNTPPWYVKKVRLVYSPGLVALPNAIDLDPCSNASSLVGARRCFTVKENGLARRWSGKVFINPPFNGILPWVEHAIREWEAGNVEAMIWVVPLCAARWFTLLSVYCSRWGVHRRRIRFYVGGKQGPGPRQDFATFYFGEQVDRFRLAFQRDLIFLPPGEVWESCPADGCRACYMMPGGVCPRCAELAA